MLDTRGALSQNRWTMTRVHSTFVSLFAAAGLLVSGAVFADSSDAPSALCGGDKKKDVKKPSDDKKQPNPASAPSALCGGDKKKDVKKPSDDKKQPNPA
jgi:hypothetical protein